VSFEASTLDASGAARTATVRDGAPIGQVLGDYELLEKLGAGGMGVVYRARQRSANRIVALKLIRPERLAELEPERRQQWLDRFQAEAQATARLQHEHIVTVYEVGSLDAVPFYSMRYVEGRTLADVVRESPLENRRTAAVLEPVARAVEHAHRAGILHRDLKPRNIMVDSSDRAFVTDFGLVKWLTEESRGVTQTGQVMGTPEYMSPEQARDSSQVTAASDLYSLGATLYDLITGRPPFQAASSIETLRQVMDEEPVAPRQLNL
jgi:serine/threonine protein kinase